MSFHTYTSCSTCGASYPINSTHHCVSTPKVQLNAEAQDVPEAKTLDHMIEKWSAHPEDYSSEGIIRMVKRLLPYRDAALLKSAREHISVQCVQIDAANREVANLRELIDAQVKQIAELQSKNASQSTMICELQEQVARTRESLVECCIPLEVIAGQLNIGDMQEVSIELAQQIHKALSVARAILPAQPAAPKKHI